MGEFKLLLPIGFGKVNIRRCAFDDILQLASHHYHCFVAAAVEFDHYLKALQNQRQKAKTHLKSDDNSHH
jgi:hypothetical protein